MSFHPIKHFIVITRHRHKVIEHCAKVGALRTGIFHDLSKYSPVEFFAGAKYFQGFKSPNSVQRELFGYSSAWLHHKGRNKHHYEYWYDLVKVDGKDEPMPIKMPLIYVKEMFCDRVAASKIYRGKKYENGHPLEYYYLERTNERLHPETAELLKSWLEMLKEKGEEVTFKHIKNMRNY